MIIIKNVFIGSLGYNLLNFFKLIIYIIILLVNWGSDGVKI